MVIPHPFLPYDRTLFPWPEPASYPYMQKDIAVLAVVSAGCLYLISLNTREIRSCREPTKEVSVRDVRDEIAEKLKMSCPRLWQVTSPEDSRRMKCRSDGVQAELLDDDDKHLCIQAPRFLVLATDGDDEKQPEVMSRASFNKLITRRHLTCARVRHGFWLLMYTVLCCIPMCIILLLLALIFGPCFLCAASCSYCQSKLRECRSRDYGNGDEIIQTKIGENTSS